MLNARPPLRPAAWSRGQLCGACGINDRRKMAVVEVVCPDGAGGGAGGWKGRGPQSVQSVPYAHEAPCARAPPSWQTPLPVKGQSSSQTIGGDGGGRGGGGRCTRRGVGDRAGGGGGDEGGLPQTQQWASGLPKSAPPVHSWPATKPPPEQRCSAL